MRKATLLVALAATVIIFGVSCDTLTDLAKPTVTATAILNGAQLRLEWTAVTDADGYRIKAGDSTWTTTGTSFDVEVPAAKVEVIAYSGSDESDPAVINCEVEETATLEVYGISDPDTTHRSSFGFNTDGTITTYSIKTANYPSMDFYMEDVQLAMSIVNSGDKGWNAKGNAAKEAALTSYDDVVVADAPGTGYSTQEAIASGAVYYLWIDRMNDGWDVSDHFAKAKVISIQGAKVTMKIGYQMIGGLRWVVN